MRELTRIINERIAELKASVNSLPCGGSLEHLDIDLAKIMDEIQTLQDFLAEINRTGA